LGGFGGALGQGRGGGGRGAHRGSVCGLRRGGKAAGEGERRWLAAAATGAPAPARRRRRQCNQRHEEVVWGCVKSLGCLVGGGRVRR
jgi:hypothetical protein